MTGTLALHIVPSTASAQCPVAWSCEAWTACHTRAGVHRGSSMQRPAAQLLEVPAASLHKRGQGRLHWTIGRLRGGCGVAIVVAARGAHGVLCCFAPRFRAWMPCGPGLVLPHSLLYPRRSQALLVFCIGRLPHRASLCPFIMPWLRHVLYAQGGHALPCRGTPVVDASARAQARPCGLFSSVAPAWTRRPLSRAEANEHTRTQPTNCVFAYRYP